MQDVYLDNAATTMVAPEVVRGMLPFFTKTYGNTSEFHQLGTKAKTALESSRATIADFLGAKVKEIIFTSGATESINLAIKGLIETIVPELLNKAKPHIITTAIEHKAVLETCRHLEIGNKAEVTYLPVDKYGLINLKDLKKAIRNETVLVSMMYVNNEVGTIEPIRKIGIFIKKINRGRKHRIYFHTDATQAVQYLNCDVNYLGVDMLTLSGHKINAPKGIGILYKKGDVSITRQADGGAQESGFRSGTENVPYIFGLAKAIELIKLHKKGYYKQVLSFSHRLRSGVLKIPGVRLTGHPKKRSPHIVSFIINGAEGEALVLHLSDKKIYASSGSACTASDLRPSHVLSAMGVPLELSHGSLRFSLSPKTNAKEIDYTVKTLPSIINKLREMSPLQNY